MFTNDNPVQTWHPELELCGLILQDGSIVALENRYYEPDKGFLIGVEDLEKYEDDQVLGMWHSHPSDNLNLSTVDYFSFLKHPDKIHRIYNSTGYRDYYVRNGLVLMVAA